MDPHAPNLDVLGSGADTLAPLAVEAYSGDSASWNRLVGESPYGHVLQSYEWGEVRRQQGQTPIRLRFLRDGSPIGLAQILFSRLPGGLGRYAYVPKGPIINFEDSATVRGVLRSLREVADAHGVLALKIEPEVRSSPGLAGLFAGAGFQPARAIQPRSTIWVDLKRSPAQILAEMKQKTRYNTRLAAKRGVEVRDENDDSALLEWYDLFQITARRDRFAVRPLTYYRQIIHTLGASGLCTLLLARLGNELIAGNLLFGLGTKAVYMYGASSDTMRNLMPTYLLQWRGMEWARERGATIYDMWGVSDQPGDELAGVSRFKEGFGGERVRYAGAFDYVRAPIRHRLINDVAMPVAKRAGRLRAARDSARGPYDSARERP